VLVAGPALAGADREIADIARLYAGATTLTGAAATVDAVLEAATGAGVLHLAAHGRLRTDNPLFSALELADGPLTGYHLESLARAPAAVVLSACSSGAGHATVADETLGLAWTLMGMGCATVVAPMLPVPDEATRDLMVALHERVARGDTISRALSLAQADASGLDPARAAVAAAFVAYGI
jgi:CHAT domain-containing protein